MKALPPKSAPPPLVDKNYVCGLDFRKPFLIHSFRKRTIRTMCNRCLKKMIQDRTFSSPFYGQLIIDGLVDIFGKSNNNSPNNNYILNALGFFQVTLNSKSFDFFFIGKMMQKVNEREESKSWEMKEGRRYSCAFLRCFFLHYCSVYNFLNVCNCTVNIFHISWPFDKFKTW